jgi:hypothetical protein
MDSLNLEFSVNQLVIDDRTCLLSDFAEIKEEIFDEQTVNKKEVLSAKKIKKTTISNRFVCIYIEQGDKYPYPDKVLDVSKSREVKNPRLPDQLELTEQFFVLIDTKKSLFYVSNQRKRKQFIFWLQEQIKKIPTVKAIIREQEFLQNIESVKEISFTVEPSLFNTMEGTLSANLAKDINGFEAEEATITLKYKPKKISDRIAGHVRGLIGRKHEFKDLTIVGRSDEHFSSVFNINEIINKVVVSAIPNPKTKKFDDEQIFNTLIGTINKND